MEGGSIEKLQSDLILLGYLNHKVTGYFGDVTLASVKRLQNTGGLVTDGIVGSQTSTLIIRLLKEKGLSSSLQTLSSDTGSIYLRKWFGDMNKVFAIGTVAEVYDILSGRTFRIKRTMGTNHADCETPTAADTVIMKQIYGDWTWSRRPVILTFNGIKIAASVAGMPHAGNDSYPAYKYVSSRSGGYRSGENLDTIKGNDMSGHFDVHFVLSKTHGTNKVDVKHQAVVNNAAEWALKNPELIKSLPIGTPGDSTSPAPTQTPAQTPAQTPTPASTPVPAPAPIPTPSPAPVS